MVPFHAPENDHSRNKCDVMGKMKLKTAEKSEVAIKAGIPHAALELFFHSVLHIPSTILTPISFILISMKLKEISIQIKEVEKKVDKLLKADLESARYRLEQAIQYLENDETQELAYQEFGKVLDRGIDAFPKVEAFEDKLLCKRIVMFARFMTNSYNVTQKKFEQFGKFSDPKKKTFAQNIHLDIVDIVSEFQKLQPSLRTRI